MNLGQYVGLTPTRYPILQNATIQSIANISISCKEGPIGCELASSEGWLAMKFVLAWSRLNAAATTITLNCWIGHPGTYRLLPQTEQGLKCYLLLSLACS